MSEQQSTTYLDVAVQTSPWLCEMDSFPEKSRIYRKNDLSYDLETGLAPASVITVRNRRHTVSNFSETDRSIDTKSRSSEDLVVNHILQENAPIPLSALSSLGSSLQTPKQLSDLRARIISGPSPRRLSPVSLTSSPTSSDSDSIEIIDHRSSFNSPNDFRHFVETNSPPSADCDSVDNAERDFRVDNEGVFF
jgi:hypothetical protein